MKKVFFAVQFDSQSKFKFLAASEAALETKIEAAFWRWKGLQPRGAKEVTKGDFLRGAAKVRVTVEPLTEGN